MKAERSLIVYEGYGLTRGLETEGIWATAAISHTVLKTMLEEKEALVMMDALADPRYKEQTSAIISSLRSVLYVPLTNPAGQPSGMCYMDNLSKTGVFGVKELDRAKTFVADSFSPMLAELAPTANSPELTWEGLTSTKWL